MNNEELLEKIQEKMDITKEELFERIDDKIEENNEKLFQRMDDKMEENNKKLKEELFQRMDDKMEKNNEKLWGKMQKQMKKDKKELKDQMDAMQKENLEFREEMREFQKGMQEQMRIVKDVNMPRILDQVTKTRKELKQANEKLDQYIEGHEVEHKKIDYELSDIRLKMKVAIRKTKNIDKLQINIAKK